MDNDSKIIFDTFLQFIHGLSDLRETLELSWNNLSQLNMKFKVISVMTVQGNNSSSTNTAIKVCPKCEGDHYLNNCAHFSQ